MIKVTLKDNTVKELPKGITAYEAAKEISMGLARNACAARINGENADLRDTLDGDCTLEILTFEDDYGRGALRPPPPPARRDCREKPFPAVF